MQLLQESLSDVTATVCTGQLCCLPAAQQLSSDDVLQLLRSAVALHSKASVAALTAVAAASRLARIAVEQLMHEATEQESCAYGCIEPLQRLLLSCTGSAS
jgi:hypothetical protein